MEKKIFELKYHWEHFKCILHIPVINTACLYGKLGKGLCRSRKSCWFSGFLSVYGYTKIHLLHLLSEISTCIYIVSGLHLQTKIISVKLFNGAQGITVNSSPHTKKVLARRLR